MLDGGEPVSNEAAYRTAGVLALGFSFHAMATRRQIVASANRPAPAARLTVLFALALAVPTWMAAPRLPGAKGLWWPLHIRETIAAVRPKRGTDPFRCLRLDPKAERVR